jgi:V8-like Glu-specific endopeptidase
MLNLQQADKVAIVRWLSELREFETESDRRRLLELAGLGNISPQIQLGGSPFIAAASVAEFLSRYGRPIPETEGLGMLLNLVSSLVGLERQKEISEILQRYSMMVPVATSPIIKFATPGFAPNLLSEKIIGQNTLRPIAFLAKGLRAARAVALVSVKISQDNAWVGTGFLVGRDVFLTNNHVVGSSDEATATTLFFNYEEDEFGRMVTSTQFKIAEFLTTDPDLDYSLLRVDGFPGDTFGWLPFQEKKVNVGDRVNIIQHPGGQPKQISLQHNLVEYVDDKVVQYITSTLPGSSGSPVLNDAWEVVALHHAGGNLTEPTTGAMYYRNEGVLAAVIRTHIPLDLCKDL